MKTMIAWFTRRSTPTHRLLKALVVVVSTLVVACSGSEYEARAVAHSAETSRLSAMGYVVAEVAEEETTDEEAGTASPRKLIQNAHLTLEVDSCEEVRQAIEAELARIGGYLSTANVTRREGRVSRAVLVLRLPASALPTFLATSSAHGSVVHESLTSEDITEQYYDLESRLTNARRLEARLLDLLATEATKLKDMLEVERELARVRETIERFEGKLRLWKQQVAFSTLTLDLSTRSTYSAVEALGLGQEISRTLSGSWQALVRVGRALLLATVAVLPWLIPVVIVVVVLRLVLRALKSKSTPGA